MSESQPEQVRIIGLRPQDVTDIFKDREDKLAQLRQLVCDQSAKLICVIGRGGIGKTALVCKVCSEIESGQLHTAEGASGAGVDGIIYIDCREENRSTLERLFHDVGRLLGRSAADDLMNCWRDSAQSLADKVRFLLGKLRQGFCLLVLDNFEVLLGSDRTFRDDEWKTFIDLCLQATHALRVIATSREWMLLQVPRTRSARMLSLESGLPESDGIALLRDLDPDGRLGLHKAPEELLREAVQRCFGVPRALESIAGILDSDPMLSLDRLLADPGLFEGQVVENLIAEHYCRLTDSQRRVLEALAVYNAPISARAVGCLLRPFFPELDTDDCLSRLVRSYVVTYRRAHNEYQLHPLDQQYAYEKLPDHGPGYTRQACHRRAAEFYRQMRKPEGEWHSIEDLSPQLQEFQHLVCAEMYDQACSVINEIDYDYLLRWGFHRLIVQLRSRCKDKLVEPGLQVDNLAGLGLAYHFLGEGNQAAECHTRGLQLALKTGDHAREITARIGLGLVFYVRGEVEKAAEYLRHAAEMAHKFGDDRKEGRALNNLGPVYSVLGEYKKAVDCLERSLKKARASGNRWSEGIRLDNLGAMYYHQLDIKKAQASVEEALSIAREVGDRRGEANRLRAVGRIHHAFGRIDKARQYYHEAVEISREIGHQRGAARTLIWLGRAYLNLGDTQKAIQQYELALTVHRATQYRSYECMALGDLGYAHQTNDDLKKAIEFYGDALTIARSIRHRKRTSELLLRLGTVYHHLGHLADAMKCYREALLLDMPSTNYSCAIRLGILWLEQGKKEDADKYLKNGLNLCNNLLKKEPELCETLYVLALGQIASEQTNEALAAYRRALEVCSATGMVQDALDNLNLLKRIPKFTSGVEDASQLLQHALNMAKKLSEPRSEEQLVATGTNETKATYDDKEKAELEKIFDAIKELEKIQRQDPYKEIMGKSQAIEDVIAKIDEAIRTEATVLITGETGVGKDMVARAIHSNGGRRQGPFVVANVAGTSDPKTVEDELFGHVRGAFADAIRDKKGMFQLADGGTIFLDEIGDLDINCQVKLLRVLQEGTFQQIGGTKVITVDVRVIAATNKNLKRAVEDGTFRQDLYYRLFVYPIEVPPLRERKEDIPMLVEHFAARIVKDHRKQKVSFTAEAMRRLLVYVWLGNVRELENCVLRAILGAKSNVIRASDLSFANLSSESYVHSPEDRERQMIIDALKSSKTVKEAVAKLPMSKSTLYEKLRKHGLGKGRDWLKRRR